MNRLFDRFQDLKSHLPFRSKTGRDQSFIDLSSMTSCLDMSPYPDSKHHKMPHEFDQVLGEPQLDSDDESVLDRIQGSMMGMALGDAIGAHVEFRPHEYLLQHPVQGLEGGGTWGLKRGQFTDDTSMALCLAASLIVRKDFRLYDQLVRYKWWFREGYMSSTGECFDIGAATRESLTEFERRQQDFFKKHKIQENPDYPSNWKVIEKFNPYCSRSGVAGNGPLMRLAPVPLFFYRHPKEAVKFCGNSAEITHGDQKAVDACRYYGALIVAALQNTNKEKLLHKEFYREHKDWFGNRTLCNEVMKIAEGSFKKPGGYEDGIRGSGYIVNALEAALWAFWSDGNSFKKGVLLAVNLGDDTDTTAAIYGQLAGAYYGYSQLPQDWVQRIYANSFILKISKWLLYEGKQRSRSRKKTSSPKNSTYPSPALAINQTDPLKNGKPYFQNGTVGTPVRTDPPSLDNRINDAYPSQIRLTLQPITSIPRRNTSDAPPPKPMSSHPEYNTSNHVPSHTRSMDLFTKTAERSAILPDHQIQMRRPRYEVNDTRPNRGIIITPIRRIQEPSTYPNYANLPHQYLRQRPTPNDRGYYDQQHLSRQSLQILNDEPWNPRDWTNSSSPRPIANDINSSHILHQTQFNSIKSQDNVYYY